MLPCADSIYKHFLVFITNLFLKVTTEKIEKISATEKKTNF
jgi:hypothetical protein